MLEKISLKNFRSYPVADLEFGNKTVLVGPNGSGKSNVLEAVYLLATGKSFRADLDDEMVHYGDLAGFVKGKLGEVELQVTVGNGLPGIRKRFEVNGVPKRMIDFVGQMRAVLFGPWDMNLITGSPSVRRRYLDFVIAQTNREYRRSWVAYEKGLRQRNKVLERIREGFANRTQLVYWDHVLIKNGEVITRAREEYLETLNRSDRTDGTNGTYKTEYDKSVISPSRIAQYEAEEVAAAATLVGPHRDDFQIEQEGRDVEKYGSRGQQRMAVLWLKIGEIKYLSCFAPPNGASKDTQQPLLLLDDVFSELDHGHRDTVMAIVEEQVKNGGQVIMTTADEHMLPEDHWNIINL